MSNWVWILEHREMSNGEMVTTILNVGSTLQKTEELMRNQPGLKETEGWYAIFPEVVDQEMFAEPWPDHVKRDAGHLILNFYDLDGKQLEQQPVGE